MIYPLYKRYVLEDPNACCIILNLRHYLVSDFDLQFGSQFRRCCPIPLTLASIYQPPVLPYTNDSQVEFIMGVVKQYFSNSEWLIISN